MSDNINRETVNKICFFCEEKEISEKYIHYCNDCGKKSSLNICPLCNIPYLTTRDYMNHMKHIDNKKALCRKYYKSLREIEKLNIKIINSQNEKILEEEIKLLKDNNKIVNELYTENSNNKKLKEENEKLLEEIEKLKTINEEQEKRIKELEEEINKYDDDNNEIQLENREKEENIKNEYYVYNILLDKDKNINETEFYDIAYFFQNTIEDYKLTHAQNIIKNNNKILQVIKKYIMDETDKILRDVEDSNYDKQNIRNKISKISKLKYYVCSYYNKKIINALDVLIHKLDGITGL